ncbi:hypothetical protein C8Q80DRAFT_1265803 [Daedaleopsis nitida]|nr:hypothetical protein C8Q80DRAFT_1265803 [Daedaleopsis nitida]
MAPTTHYVDAPLRDRTHRRSRQDYTRVEVIYYHLKRLDLPPAPKPPLIPLPDVPYIILKVPDASGQASHQPRSGRHSDSHPELQKPTARDRRVHFADQPTVINPSNHPNMPHPPPPSPVPPPLPPKPSCNLSTINTPPPACSTSDLHPYLSSFPPHVWDTRRRASPPYVPAHEARFSEPAFLTDRARAPTSIRLAFLPCSRTELAWFVTVAPSGTHLVVADVVRAVSVELFRRSVCRELYTEHPCFARAQAAQQWRAKAGWTDAPWYGDAIRNVDLYHVEGERGPALWFKGLKEERLRDGHVVYRVLFGSS